MTGNKNILAIDSWRGSRTNQTWRKSGGTQTEVRHPKEPEGNESEPTGKDEGSRSNA
jgi:ribosomal protein L32E